MSIPTSKKKTENKNEESIVQYSILCVCHLFNFPDHLDFIMNATFLFWPNLFFMFASVLGFPQDVIHIIKSTWPQKKISLVVHTATSKHGQLLDMQECILLSDVAMEISLDARFSGWQMYVMQANRVSRHHQYQKIDNNVNFTLALRSSLIHSLTCCLSSGRNGMNTSIRFFSIRLLCHSPPAVHKNTLHQIYEFSNIVNFSLSLW